MKPAWDKLMAEFKDHPSALVADVDCTADGQSLCETVGVQGYPTIKWGNPDALEDYKGGRDYEALSKFANENFAPTCGPDNRDLCDEEQKARIDKFMKKSVDYLTSKVRMQEGKLEAAEMRLMKAILAARKRAAGKSEL